MMLKDVQAEIRCQKNTNAMWALENVMGKMAELVEAVVVAHTFSMEIVSLLVGFSLEKLQLNQKQLC